MSQAADPAETFRLEARDLIENLEQALLDLEQNPSDSALVDQAFRAMHTLKGSGAMFGFDAVAQFVHEFETAFDEVRKGRAPIGVELVRIALSALDHIQNLIRDPASHQRHGEPILEGLRLAVAGGSGISAHAGDAAFPEAGSAADRAYGGGWRIAFYLPEDALAFGTNPMLLLDELRDIGPCRVQALIDRVPPLDTLDPARAHLGWEVFLDADATARERIEDVFLFIRDGMELSIEPLAAEIPAAADSLAPMKGVPDPAGPSARAEAATSQPAAPSSGRLAEPADRGATSLRVAAERLDELMDRVGELVIAQSRLSQIAAASADLNLKSVAEELERLASGLRDTTMGIRMVPIGSLFGRFRRLVHDLSHDLGKEIEFVTTGEETELDKTMIERLADPLVHLIRNCVDHGIETPDIRTSAGKQPRGRVRLSAVHTGAEVAISIADDGRGLDARRIRAKAEEQGLLQPDQRISDADLYQLIFHPGFSTAAQITSLSGRGVGMDVVKRTIDGLRGSIDIATLPGQGTTATLRLPLTLAIIEGMLIRVGQGRYSIPLSAVEECVELPAEAERSDQGRHFLNIRGGLVPFLRLRELFATTAPPDPHPKVVIVSSGEARVGLVVDQIIGNSQTVIKSLSRLHADVETFSGATILGDGSVALILDVANLVSFGQKLEARLRDERVRRAA